MPLDRPDRVPRRGASPMADGVGTGGIQCCARTRTEGFFALSVQLLDTVHMGVTRQ